METNQLEANPIETSQNETAAPETVPASKVRPVNPRVIATVLAILAILGVTAAVVAARSGSHDVTASTAWMVPGNQTSSAAGRAYDAGVALIKQHAKSQGKVACDGIDEVGEDTFRANFMEGFQSTNPSGKVMSAEQAWSIFRAEIPC